MNTSLKFRNTVDRLQAFICPMMHGRPYHNVDHVLACIAALGRYRHLAQDPAAVELALWIHDAVCDPTRSDNEAKSAELGDRLLSELGLSAELVAKVHELVLATRHDRDPGYVDAWLIADIDLMILAAPPDEFDRYERNIRQEYQHVSGTAFARGRSAVLARLLQRSRIFYILDEHEQYARENLQRSVNRLKLP